MERIDGASMHGVAEIDNGNDIPNLPRDLWRFIIQIVADKATTKPFAQIVHMQTLAHVSKEFYELISQWLTEESRKQGLEFIPKILQLERSKIGLVEILHRLKESVYGRKSPLLIVDYYERHFRCPICAKKQQFEGDTNDRTPRKLTCPDCTSKYGITIEWQDDGTNRDTERCEGCRRLGTRYNYGLCEGCSAGCCLDCCGRSMMGLMLCKQCAK